MITFAFTGRKKARCSESQKSDEVYSSQGMISIAFKYDKTRIKGCMRGQAHRRRGVTWQAARLPCRIRECLHRPPVVLTTPQSGTATAAPRPKFDPRAPPAGYNPNSDKQAGSARIWVMEMWRAACRAGCGCRRARACALGWHTSNNGPSGS